MSRSLAEIDALICTMDDPMAGWGIDNIEDSERWDWWDEQRGLDDYFILLYFFINQWLIIMINKLIVYCPP